MANRIKTTKQEIADYWEDELHLTNVKKEDATTCCWRCGIKKRLDRAHIIPRSKGGGDSPENFVLLCKHCHFDNPNIDNMEIVWEWFQAYQLKDNESLWMNQGKREYEYIYGVSIDQELKDLKMTWEQFEPYLNKQLDNATHHFGQPGFNRATVAGAIRLAIKEIGEGSHEDTQE